MDDNECCVSEIPNPQEKQHENTKNRGTGAGGSNTNKNGVKLEDRTRKTIDENIEQSNLSEKYKTTGKRKWNVTEGNYNGIPYIRAPESAFKSWEKIEGNQEQMIPKAHGTKEPDDLIVNKKTKTINWLECKVQNGGGSVVEKLQSCPEKIENLKRRFPGWNINYVYILSSYIREISQWEILRLNEKNILYIFEDDEYFSEKLMDYSFR